MERPRVTGITIDGPTSLDLDDAFWLESQSDTITLTIHIADVAAHIPLGSDLDKEAFRRTQTRYFRKSNDPMLPRKLSEDKLSLLAGETRDTLTIEFHLSPSFAIQATKIFESTLISQQKLSYDLADHYLANHTHPLHLLLKRAQALAQHLNAQRRGRGAIGGMQTAAGWIDEDGRLTTGKSYHSQVIVAELMILANQTLAQWLVDHDTPALYRNHAPRQIAPDDPDLLPALLGLGSLVAVRKQLNNWMGRAGYGPKLLGHYALALPAYGHFTSPIRRYADLVNWWIIKALLRGDASPYTQTELGEIATHINTTTLALEEEKSQHFRAKSETMRREILANPEALKELQSENFTGVLKLAIQEGSLAELEHELKRRLTEETLSIVDLYLLVIANEDKAWQQHSLDYLASKPHLAVSVLNAACQHEETWKEWKYVESADPYSVRVKVLIQGEWLTTPTSYTGQSKKLTQQTACLEWLKTYAEKELINNSSSAPKVVQLKTTPPAASIPELKSGGNWVGQLNEVCQKNGWDSPGFILEEHEQGFSCTCTLLTPLGDFAATELDRSKQRAKRLAAGKLLKDIALRSREANS